MLPPGQASRFTLPSPPGRPERRPVPVLMAVAPALLGVAMAVFLRQVYMLALAAFSPVMLLGSYVSDRRYGRKSYARHPDYLLLRVGTGDLPSAAELTDPAADEHRRQRRWLIPDTPVTFLLAERAVAGVAGPVDVPRAAGRWLVAQLAALHSPQDVQICILTDSGGHRPSAGNSVIVNNRAANDFASSRR